MTIETVSITLPGLSAARKPRVTPTQMAKAMAAKTSFSDGQMRPPISLVTGSRVRNEMPRSPVATLPTYLAKRSCRGSSSPISLRMRSMTAGSITERPSSFMPEMKLPGQDAEQQEDQRDDGEQRRDDVAEATNENEEHQVSVTAFNKSCDASAPGGGEEHDWRASSLLRGDHFAGDLASTQMSSGYWCVISVGLACRPWIHG